jgi:hypothetical protein
MVQALRIMRRAGVIAGVNAPNAGSTIADEEQRETVRKGGNR